MRLVSFLFAAGLGYAAGMLCNSKKGQDLRNDIWDRISGCDAGRAAIEKGMELKEVANEKLQKTTDSINQTKDAAMEKGRALKAIANDGIDKAAESLNDMKSVALDTKNELKNIAEESLSKASASIGQAKASASEKVSQLNKEMQSIASDTKKVLTEG